MSKKNLSIIFVIITFLLTAILFIPRDKIYIVENVISPLHFIINNQDFEIKNLETFDSFYSKNNIKISKLLNITENEAFILGNLANQWTKNLMQGRKIYVSQNDIIYYRNSYVNKFMHSGFCIKDSKPYSEEAFSKKLTEIRKNKYVIIDLETDKVYEINENNASELKKYLVIKRKHLPKIYENNKKNYSSSNGELKVFLTDFTAKLKPDKTCSTSICREIVQNINNANKSIDIAIYGYSEVPAIEKALIKAKQRGVKIRLVYDLDSNQKSIYPDMEKLTTLIPNNKNDGKSSDAQYIMHNKFYIFDNKILITGSANLSHTDMSGFNTNSIITINSEKIANLYKKEFEQMYNGKYHNNKISHNNKEFNLSGTKIKVYFSPQDKSLTNAILPLIQNAKNYIYIPTFVLTEKRVTEELIKAKTRGVDVKIIIDALNASIRHSKHKELREGKILVKTENYAGKMHSKSMIVDDKFTVIGSMNFSNSGENKNDENLIVIENPEITKYYKDFFLYQWNQIDNQWLYKNVRAESKDSIGSCFDGLDNNYDGLADSLDVACK